MAKGTIIKLTKSKLALEGVQLTMVASVGDWRKSVAVSPIDYEMFKKKFYVDRMHQQIIKQIEWELEK